MQVPADRERDARLSSSDSSSLTASSRFGTTLRLVSLPVLMSTEGPFQPEAEAAHLKPRVFEILAASLRSLGVEPDER